MSEPNIGIILPGSKSEIHRAAIESIVAAMGGYPAIIGLDFGHSEITMISMYGNDIHHKRVDPSEFYMEGIQGRKANICIMDDIFEPDLSEPVKQNGRSAAYLKFDSTKTPKKHRR